jgi:hypothetical protein
MTPDDRARHDANRAEAVSNLERIREEWKRIDAEYHAVAAAARKKIEDSFAAGFRAHDIMTGDVVAEPEAAPELPPSDLAHRWRHEILGMPGSVEQV